MSPNPLPVADAAAEASLAAINAKLPSSLGAHVIAASLAVNIASDQVVPISATSLPLPAGASTSALQTSGNASLSSIDSKLNTLGQKAMAASVPVVIASDQSTIPVSAASLPLPAGAATSALQTTGNTSLASIDGKLNSLGQKTMANSVPVVIASDQSSIAVSSTEAGFSKANAPVRNDYSSVNVTTAAYVQLVASLTSATKEIEIFDSSGQTLVLAVGAAASEVDQINIFPGGNGRVKLAIPAASRISIKAVSATASVGEIDINFYG